MEKKTEVVPSPPFPNARPLADPDIWEKSLRETVLKEFGRIKGIPPKQVISWTLGPTGLTVVLNDGKKLRSREQHDGIH